MLTIAPIDQRCPRCIKPFDTMALADHVLLQTSRTVAAWSSANANGFRDEEPSECL